MTNQDKNVPGGWEPPPPTLLMSSKAVGFGLIALIAMLLHYCELGSMLAAVAFSYGVVNVFEIVLWKNTAYWRGIEPAKPAPSIALAAGSAAFTLGGALGGVVNRCNFAILFLVIAVLLGLAGLFQRWSTRSAGAARSAASGRPTVQS